MLQVIIYLIILYNFFNLEDSKLRIESPELGNAVKNHSFRLENQLLSNLLFRLSRAERRIRVLKIILRLLKIVLEIILECEYFLVNNL